ncbi:hypothetical protein T484DRAFT_1984916 [Baffinella frigidus]|nr:hypothetical protein T484DRAFT_1984916 [Cryptophyta sp. CCMP2293]|mmetsp:Transcript_21721/g.52267  ORF Transcript_21721/g.52267 Transcript_21721/m.52267 type:complete len:154 (-) Transcript_21721:58-519(-)
MGAAQSQEAQRAAKDVRSLSNKKCGMLQKAGLDNKAFRKRFCAVYDMHLYYYLTSNSNTAQGAINLHGAHISVSKSGTMKIETAAFIVEAGNEQRSYYFVSDAGDDVVDITKPDDEIMRIRQKAKLADMKRWAKWCEAEACKTYTPDLRRKRP